MARHKTLPPWPPLPLREQLDAQARAGRIRPLIDAPLQAAQTSLQLRLLTVYRRAPADRTSRPPDR